MYLNSKGIQAKEENQKNNASEKTTSAVSVNLSQDVKPNNVSANVVTKKAG